MKAEDFEQPAIHYKPARGFVVLLDALGVRTMSGDDIDLFLEQRRFILNLLTEMLPALNRGRSKERLALASNVPTVMAFGDTFAITWAAPAPHPYSWLRELQEFASAISYVVALSFISGLRLRGALAYGDFYFDTDVIIGPAVADAALWYEQADWLGVIATPATEIMVIAQLNDPNEATPDPEENLGSIQEWLLPLRRDFVRVFLPTYNVPLREGYGRSMMAINWPYSLFCLGPDITLVTGEHVAEFFRRKLDSFIRPPSAQAKYDNTAAFYAFCQKHTVQLESQSPMLAIQRAMTSDTPLEWFRSFLKRYGGTNT